MKSKIKKNFPRITIERIGFNNDGHVTFIDIHDEKFGEAIFFGDGARHYHGFHNEKQYDTEI
jgi:hypothetical protein